MSTQVRGAAAESPDASASALEKLMKYIPADVVTLYVAALGTLPTIQKVIHGADAKWVYWIAAAATPIVLVIVFVGKRRVANESAFPGISGIPWWGMVSATTAFLIWGCTVPSSAYLTSDAGKVVAGFGAILGSTALSLLEPVFNPKGA